MFDAITVRFGKSLALQNNVPEHPSWSKYLKIQKAIVGRNRPHEEVDQEGVAHRVGNLQVKGTASIRVKKIDLITANITIAIVKIGIV